MSTKFSLEFLIVMTAFLVLTACGGGGGGSQVAGGGIGGTGVSYGTVTDFGSIILNDSHLDDSTASITLDDNPGAGPHGGLKRGMVVKVTGTFSGNTGTATTIAFRDNLEGPVCDKQTVDGITTLRVLGQVVIVDATTVVENSAAINLGDIVEVSGLADSQERIHASFIENKTAGAISPVIEVKGRVDSVNGLTGITINALNVDISTATIDNSIPGGQPAVGQFVEVKGSASGFTCGAATDTLVATSIELEAEGAGAIAAGVRAEVEGFVTEVNAGGFKIGNQQIATSGGTLFLPDDFSAADIVVGAKVEAEGIIANGVLTATKISFRENVKLESDVASGDSSSFTLAGLPGITINTDGNTEFKSVSVVPGTHVRVRGREGPNNTVLATRVESQGGSTVFLQGAVDTVATPDITVLGVTINTGAISQFMDADDNLISSATFFELLQPGTLVKIKGDLQAGIAIWSEAELED
jgi:RecA/RadA recombinase